MKLKELRLYGFKSFPHKTVLELSPGITALVGPNGCGKSNVLDSIRWVLGEQTLSRLRCARNEDLVFAGSARQPEQGYAEVSLVIDNEGDFPYLPAEVEIRRRYYRTGEASFWINREECRLKEIEAILRGGAAGGRLYSVFDAAKLASIVGGDLANLMESAAGVLGFRERRRESERKLELVRRDLIRLEDIVGERERIVRSLARQRRRAALYKELRERMAGLESRKLRIRFVELAEELEAKEQGIKGEEERERELLLLTDEIRKRVREQDAELSKLIEQERGTRNALEEIARSLSAVTSDLSASRARLAALEENLVRVGDEREKYRVRAGELETSMKETAAARGEAVKRRETAQEHLEVERGKLKGDEEALANLRIRVRAGREELKKLAAQLARLAEERTRERSRGENAAALAVKAREELARLSERAGTLHSREKETQENLSRTRAALAQRSSQMKDLEQSLSQTSKRIVELEGARQEALDRQSMLSGSTASLREKVEQKPRRMLRERLGKRFTGWVEEFLSYPEELEAALEAVLYDVLGFATSGELPGLEGEEGGLEELSLEGQAGMILARPQESTPGTRPSDPRFRLWLADNVKLKESAPPFVRSRLAQWVVVDKSDLASAAHDYPGLSFVSVDGTALRADGVALLGRPRGVLADRRVLNELEKEAQSLSRNVASLEKELELARKKRDGLATELEEARRAYLEEVNHSKLEEAELSRLKENAAELERERDGLRREANARVQEADQVKEKLSELEEEIASRGKKHALREEELAEAEKSLAGEEESLREKLAALNDLLLAVSREEAAERSIAERLRQLELEAAGLAELASSRESEENKARSETEELRSRIVGLTHEKETLEERSNQEKKKLAAVDTSALIQAKSENQEIQGQREKELEALRANLVRLRTDVLLLKREKEEVESAVPKGEEAGELPQATVDDLERELEETRRRLDELGPINEYAAVQYEEEKVELDRLKAQHADVTQAAESLTRIITEIDGEATLRYDSAFRAVREEFRRTFNFFFPGGEADLRLENPEDAFNSPIQITARPEGKQLKRLAQLSDGERTMLGISLLFAFYAVRPAPFLFVDELDAPLDDSNVLKFASFLARIKDRIQVFVITHNKRTMEKADTIYGVTMEEPGVSRIISVRLKDVKRQHVAVEEA